MRILFSSTSRVGHLLPFALACRRTGHEVLLAAPRSAWLHVARTGVPFAAVADPPGRSALLRRWRPDVVLGESCDATRALGIPVLPVDCRLDDRHREPFLTLAPASLDGGRAGAWRFVAPAGRVDPLPAWWGRSQAPLVCVSLSSVALAREAATALGALDVRVLVMLRSDLDTGPVPANAHVERWLPHARVLPFAAAMVGDGDPVAALAAQVPLALVSGERFAHRVEALGAGLALDGVDRLANAVQRLLHDPAYWLAAGRVSDEIAALRPIDDLPDLLRGFTEKKPLAA